MVRVAFLACLLGLLATAAPAGASPAPVGWPFWLSRPERHGQRKLPGDYTHINTTYRNHSRHDGGGLFSFLHAGSRRSALARRQRRPHAHRGGRKRTSGLF